MDLEAYFSGARGELQSQPEREQRGKQLHTAVRDFYSRLMWTDRCRCGRAPSRPPTVSFHYRCTLNMSLDSHFWKGYIYTLHYLRNRVDMWHKKTFLEGCRRRRASHTRRTRSILWPWNDIWSCVEIGARCDILMGPAEVMRCGMRRGQRWPRLPKIKSRANTASFPPKK